MARKHSSHYRTPVWLTLVAGFYLAGAGPVIAAQQTQPPADPKAASISLPGVPDRPNLVTAVPFYQKENMTNKEKTKVVIPAWVDSVFGLFVVDLGAPRLNMNRTFLQPSPTGGVDSVTDDNRIPDRIPESSHEDPVNVTLRIGTLSVVPNSGLPGSDSGGPNAFLNHRFGNFSWVFAPRLGNIGLSVLEQFETIIDYPNRRLILIRLDSVGNRMVDVPLYKPAKIVPLVDVKSKPKQWSWWGIKVRPPPDYTLDMLDPAQNTKTVILDTGAHINTIVLDRHILGYPFLRPLGVVGFNHRRHQFILYQ